jgi:hypothetical protein
VLLLLQDDSVPLQQSGAVPSFDKKRTWWDDGEKRMLRPEIQSIIIDHERDLIK